MDIYLCLSSKKLDLLLDCFTRSYGPRTMRSSASADAHHRCSLVMLANDLGRSVELCYREGATYL
jgi:hypothetical protein